VNNDEVGSKCIPKRIFFVLNNILGVTFMSKFSQKECVYNAVQAFLADSGREHELDNAQPISLSKSDKQTVVGMVCAASDVMELSSEATIKYNSPQKFKVYVIGLVNNWIRKDTRLNGGEKYQTKNPGSRAGSGDEQIKALKALKSTLTSLEDIEAIDKAIETRTAEIKPIKTVAINVDALPEAFRHLAK
jgi:hypothetical protein